MAGEPLPAKREVRAGEREAFLEVRLHLLRRPSKHRTDGEVSEGSLRRLCTELTHHVKLHPIVVSDEHRLRGALLATRGVRILVRLPHDVVDLRRIGPKDLPVESRVLELHLTAQVDGQFLRHALRAGEEAHLAVALHHDLVHHRPVAVDEVDVGLRQPNVVEHADELLHHDGHL